MNTLKTFIRNNFSYLSLAGLLIGAAGGYLYYYFIGCNSGSCAITSNPFMSVLWGAVFGFLVFDMFKANKKKKTDQEEDVSS